jgi:hypothetical protein
LLSLLPRRVLVEADRRRAGSPLRLPPGSLQRDASAERLTSGGVDQAGLPRVGLEEALIILSLLADGGDPRL